MTQPNPTRFPLTVTVDPRLELDALRRYAGTFEYVSATYDPGCAGCNVSLHSCMFDKAGACCPECRHEVVREVGLEAAIRTLLERGHAAECSPPDEDGPGLCACELTDLAQHLRELGDTVRAILPASPPAP